VQWTYSILYSFVQRKSFTVTFYDFSLARAAAVGRQIAVATSRLFGDTRAQGAIGADDGGLAGRRRAGGPAPRRQVRALAINTGRVARHEAPGWMVSTPTHRPHIHTHLRHVAAAAAAAAAGRLSLSSLSFALWCRSSTAASMLNDN